MDKYQEDLMRNVSFVQYDLTNMKYVVIPCDNNSIKIIQNEDITHAKYIIYLERGLDVISKVEVCENESFRMLDKISLKNFSEKFNKNREEHVIELDFDNPTISKIKIYFVNDLAAPLEISIEYVFANKEEYYQKIEQERIKELIELMRVTHSCGHDLVTIKFKHCSEGVASTQIILFDDMLQLMGKFKVDEDMFYKSITNLAYGSYNYKVEQYNKDNQLIVATDYIEFCIKNPLNEIRRILVDYR